MHEDLHEFRKWLQHQYNDIPQEDSTSIRDCIYLHYLVKNVKPKKILEIGTWIGKSTYALALAGDPAEVHTIDKWAFMNMWVEIPNKTHNIFRYDMTSLEFFKQNKNEFDFMFIDGNIDQEDIKEIFDCTPNKFNVVFHDFYVDDPEDKGTKNVYEFMNTCTDYNYKFLFESDIRTSACCARLEIKK